MARYLRGLKESQKVLTDDFYKLSRNRSGWEVWQDFVLFMGCAISNTVDMANREQREQMYMERAKRYTPEEMNLFAAMYAAVVEALEANPKQDYLGNLFMLLDLGNSWKGQFFTPYHVCQAMAEVTLENVKAEVEERGYISVADSCCGAGATLIAAANTIADKKVNYQQHVLFVGQDIDFTAVMMCYVQLSLLGCPGYVKWGNALSDPLLDVEPTTENIWYTPFYFADVWHWRRIWKQSPAQRKQWWVKNK